MGTAKTRILVNQDRSIVVRQMVGHYVKGCTVGYGFRIVNNHMTMDNFRVYQLGE